MFTIEQIEELHGRLGSAKTLAEYVRSLAGLGVVRYDSYVSDGHSEYVGHDGHRVISQPVHDPLSIAADSDRKAFLDHLRRHERGETSYLEMSKGMADSGVERWTVDTNAMTMTFHDRSGELLLAEHITPTDASLVRLSPSGSPRAFTEHFRGYVTDSAGNGRMIRRWLIRGYLAWHSCDNRPAKVLGLVIVGRYGRYDSHKCPR